MLTGPGGQWPRGRLRHRAAKWGLTGPVYQRQALFLGQLAHNACKPQGTSSCVAQQLSDQPHSISIECRDYERFDYIVLPYHKAVGRRNIFVILVQ